ncbi:MAG: methylated-DNA--[protein]-cysteine S-methyltransferase [Phycisphaerales bacterium]|jgi:methylated-DNA-[protein]-cysteine S-methyltransferase|nr:methylated-DNA--[protein]-cysteine S-methyltransferase [Phycisphaerales bacterium]MBT7171768.1 methylated-DNA--[protein]-cysteine S-methyltransferase [Phycisphaerales bacterium]
MPTTPTNKITLAVRTFPLGTMGVAIANKTIIHVALLGASKRAALDLLPEGQCCDTPLSEAFWRLCDTYFASGQDLFASLPVAMADKATFAGKVYRALRTIPAGDTITYGELARRIGQPTAARAVAGALGRNPTPLILPCHRVVGKTSLGGFSAPGGVETKKRLLALEAAARQDKGPSS